LAQNKKPIYIGDVVAATGAANGPAHDGEGFDELIIYINCTAWTSGGPVPIVDGSPDGGTTWYRIFTGTAIGSISMTGQKVSSPIPKLFRIGATFSGTATYSMHCELNCTGSTSK